MASNIGRSGFLFHGNDELFKSLAKDCKRLRRVWRWESTVWIANNTSAKVIAVDTSEKWINKVTKRTKRRKNISIHHSDLGDVGFMGRPKNYSRRDFFSPIIQMILGIKKKNLILSCWW